MAWFHAHGAMLQQMATNNSLIDELEHTFVNGEGELRSTAIGNGAAELCAYHSRRATAQ
jgi:hypothetical protein